MDISAALGRLVAMPIFPWVLMPGHVFFAWTRGESGMWNEFDVFHRYPRILSPANIDKLACWF